MTEFRHDPNSLADRLDQLLPPGKPEQIGTDGDPLIETAARIASAPRPTLSPEAMARIQAQITQVQPVAPQRFPVRIASSGRLALVAAFAVILIVGSVFAARELGITLIAPTETSTATSTLTETPTQTPSVTPSSTPTATIQPTETATNTPEPTATSTIAASNTPLPTEDISVLPTITPTLTTQPGMVVVEGPVESINGNIVVIYDIEIEVDPNDPILAVIQVGDHVRIEGTVGVVGSTVVVIAVTVVVVDIDVSVSSSGEVWRDEGDCSNPPPPWAPAHGWRARCEGAPPPGNSGGMGMGMGNPDDDDDD